MALCRIWRTLAVPLSEGVDGGVRGTHFRPDAKQCCSASDLQCCRKGPPLRFRMRSCFVLVCLGALCACAEAVEGPRVVAYSADRFYVRHLPWRDSRSSVERLAGTICEQVGREATLESAYQYALLDIRYATYRCTEIAPTADNVGGQRSGYEPLPCCHPLL